MVEAVSLPSVATAVGLSWLVGETAAPPLVPLASLTAIFFGVSASSSNSSASRPCRRLAKTNTVEKRVCYALGLLVVGSKLQPVRVVLAFLLG